MPLHPPEAEVAYCYERARWLLASARDALGVAARRHPCRGRDDRCEWLQRAFEDFCEADRWRHLARAARAAAPSAT